MFQIFYLKLNKEIILIWKNFENLAKKKHLYEFFKSNEKNFESIQTFDDSLKFHNSEFLSSNTNTIQLKLFIDAYSTANPFADSRRKYIYQGTYFKLNNINHSLLSKNDVTQLVWLFEDRYTKTYSFERGA